MSPQTSLKARIQAGHSCYGLAVVLPCPSSIELAALAGYDFVRIDCEHSLMSPAEVRLLLQTARLRGIPCQVRVPDLSSITPLLGQEPAGIMLPHTESAYDARCLTDACRFSPTGRRGMDGNTRRMRCEGMSRGAYMAASEEELNLIVQLESRPALEHIDEILSVPGIDMVATGRADLSQELGVPGQKDHPEVTEAENFIIRKALEHGKLPTITAGSPQRIRELQQLGVRCFIIGKDEDLLDKGIRARIQRCTDA